MAVRRGELGFETVTDALFSSFDLELSQRSDELLEVSSKEPEPGSLCFHSEDDNDLDVDDDCGEKVERLPIEREAHEAQLGFRSSTETVEAAVVGIGAFEEGATLTEENDLAERLRNTLFSVLVFEVLLLLVALRFSFGMDAPLNKGLPTIGLSLVSSREAKPDDVV